MKTTLCTLYNSWYLDKGLVLLDSLKECTKDFELYVLCMDEKCHEVLSSIHDEHLIPIHLKDIENEEMLIAKSNRSSSEYCWTCTSCLIQYVLDFYHPEACTYIDADMYFYQNPQVLIDEMFYAGKSVMIVPHRFSPNNELLSQKVGKYCVEFNTFCNNPEGREVLNYWHKKCLECCSNLGDGIHWGDQKYLDEWPSAFPSAVHVCTHDGAGIAPFNIEWYKDFNNADSSVSYKKTGKRIKAIFYHFQSLIYYSRNEIGTGILANRKDIDYKLVDSFYYDYLKRIDAKKEYIKNNYHFNILIKHHPSNKAKFRDMIKSVKFIRDIWRCLHKSNTLYVIMLK